MLKKLTLTAAIAAALSAGSAQAASILYWADFAIGPDAMAAALAASSHTVTTATGEGDFVTKVGAGGWDLVIFMNQNSGNPSAHAAISGWVDGGGKGILADWTSNATTGAAFDTSYNGTFNETSFTISNPALAVGMVDPTVLVNPGWGIFSVGMVADVDGDDAADFAGGDAIVIGNGGRTIANGFLNDTFTSFAQGVQLYTNEINLLLDAVVVPEPSSYGLMAVALIAAGVARRRAAQADR